jgi:hypothetical protein
MMLISIVTKKMTPVPIPGCVKATLLAEWRECLIWPEAYAMLR